MRVPQCSTLKENPGANSSAGMGAAHEHMNSQGYALWTSIIKSVLLEEAVHEEPLAPGNEETGNLKY
jgi:hypothetical protein